MVVQNFYFFKYTFFFYSICSFVTVFGPFNSITPRHVIFLGISAKIFFLKIGIHSAKVYTKNIPNIEVCDFIPATPRIMSLKQVIVVLY